MAFDQAFNLEVHGVSVIVYPDESLGERSGDIDWIGENIGRSAQRCSEKLRVADYAICFAWRDNLDFMADLWTFSGSQTWGSGPLADVDIFRNGNPDHSSGVGSGNSLLVLGLEERLRRQCATKETYLVSPRPALPSELIISKGRQTLMKIASPKKLTADETAGLEAVHNLADAHTHQSPTNKENSHIFRHVTSMIEEGRQRRGPALDREAFRAFMEASAQLVAVDDWFVPTYSSSVSIEIVANVLKGQALTIALTEPTFDCIPDILKRNGFEVRPISLLGLVDYYAALERAIDRTDAPDVIFLVIPNNPTGHVLSAGEFAQVAKLCAREDIILVLDTSFRPFDERFMFDQYDILKRMRTNFIAIEDTGKLWPTLDIKISFITGAARFRDTIEKVSNDILLNVSPFASVLVREYSRMSAADDFKTVRNVVQKNRSYLREQLAPLMPAVRFPYESSLVSAEMLQLPDGIDANAVAAQLFERGVATLSGAAFFWHSTPVEQFLRVALARDTKPFRLGVKKLTSELSSILSGKW